MPTPPRQTTSPYLSPHVRRLAESLSVDATTLAGTGVGGRVTLADVRHASNARIARTARPGDAIGRASLARPTGPQQLGFVMTTGADGTPIARHSTSWDMVHSWEGVPSLVAPVDPYSANPLLEHYRATMGADAADRIRRVSDFGRPPTLFKTGDLPVMTASGLDPAKLRGLPWEARHAAAAASSAEVAAIFEDCGSGDETAIANASIHHGQHPGNRDYELRMQTWTMEGPRA